MSNDLASVIVNNYNYERFLREAIDSALNQTYRNTEVIVVDDGSTDGSLEIIATYGQRIIPLLKGTGGQRSALNAGLSLSRGDVILFLDSDDVLFRTAVRAAVDAFSEPDVVKVHWPWLEWDDSSRETGKVWWKSLPDGGIRDLVLRAGPEGVAGWLPRCQPHPPPVLPRLFSFPDPGGGAGRRRADA